MQLADLSLVRSLGLVKDVLVRVNDLSFPPDFYILDVNADSPPADLSFLLCRPFLKTSNTLINADKGSLQMEQGGKTKIFLMIDTPTTTNLFCSSSTIFQDSGQPPNLEVRGDDLAVCNGSR